MIDPIKAFGNSSKATLVLFGCCIMLVMVLFIQPIIIIDIMKKRENYVSIDPSGTFYISPGKSFDEIKEMHDYSVSLAVMTLLMQGPKGYDNTQLLEQLTTSSAYAKAMNDFKLNKKYFEERKIHQKVEHSDFKITETHKDHIMAVIEGQIIQNGVFEGTNYIDHFKFKMNLRMGKNQRLGTNGRLPLLIENWAITMERVDD